VTTTTRLRFDRELSDLKGAVLLMGSGARKSVDDGLQAFIENDLGKAGEVISADEDTNRLRNEIEQRCYALLAREQPVAGDMRQIVAALGIVSELERIGDHGKKLARICQRTASEARPIPLDGITRMGKLALAMLDRTLATLTAADPVAAAEVAASDDEVDALYKQTFNVTLSYMIENPRSINAGAYLLQVAHELERVADRATNIAERVIYAASGQLVDLNA